MKHSARCVPCDCSFADILISFPVMTDSSVSCATQDQDFRSQKHFVINMTCRFCWQLPETDYECSNSTSCMTVSCPRQRYTANCTVRDHVHCLGEPGRRAWGARCFSLSLRVELQSDIGESGLNYFTGSIYQHFGAIPSFINTKMNYKNPEHLQCSYLLKWSNKTRQNP